MVNTCLYMHTTSTPLYEFSCKQLLVAIILSIGYSIVDMANTFYVFRQFFDSENTTQIHSSFAMGEHREVLYRKRGLVITSQHVFCEFRPVKRAHYFLM